MDMVSPMGIQLRQAKERIEFLENELNRGGFQDHQKVKEERRVQIQSQKEISEIQDETVEKLKKRNRDLLERIVFLEKAQDDKKPKDVIFSHQNDMIDYQNTIEILEKERNAYKVR